MKNIFVQGDNYIAKGNYVLAFRLYKEIAEDNNISNADRAASYNMMGVSVLFEPSLDPENETGLKYFKKAIEFDPTNSDVLWNIIETFGVPPNSHNEVELLHFSIQQLYKIGYAFNKTDIERIKIKEEEAISISNGPK